MTKYGFAVDAPDDSVGIGAVLTARIAVPRGEGRLIVARGVEEIAPSDFWEPRRGLRSRPFRLERDADVLYLSRHNAFVNLGLHFVLDRIFNINTPNTAITHMGISDDTAAVTATTLLLDASAGGGSPNIRALASGVGAAATTRSGNTVTCSAGWEPPDFSTVFSITKVGLLNTSTDAGDDTVPTVQGIMNIIGGTGGAAPYNEPFTIDLRNVSDFDLTLQQQITGQAT